MAKCRICGKSWYCINHDYGEDPYRPNECMICRCEECRKEVKDNA